VPFSPQSLVILPAAILVASCGKAAALNMPEIEYSNLPPIVSFLADLCLEVQKNPKVTIDRLSKVGFNEATFLQKSRTYFKQQSSQTTAYGTSVAPDGIKKTDAKLMANKFGYPIQSFLFYKEEVRGQLQEGCGGVLIIGMSEVKEIAPENAIIDGLFKEIKSGLNQQKSIGLDLDLTEPEDHLYIWRDKKNSNVTVSIQRFAPVMSLIFANEE